MTARLPAAAFGTTGVLAHHLTTNRSVLARLTARDRQGVVVGIGNPVWLLDGPPPGGVPAARSGRAGRASG